MLEARLADPDDQKIIDVMKEAQQRGYATKPAFKQITEKAERKIAEPRSLRTVRSAGGGPVSERQVTSTKSLLFASRLDSPLARSPTPLAGLLDGVLRSSGAACSTHSDENDSGHVLWATRTGIDADILPLTIRASDRNPKASPSSSPTTVRDRASQPTWPAPRKAGRRVRTAALLSQVAR